MKAQKLIVTMAFPLALAGLSVHGQQFGPQSSFVEFVQSTPSCIPPKCPEPTVTYQPPYPELGQYSVAGACAPIHSALSARVVLRDDETLRSALMRLQELSITKEINGVIEVPWGADTVQCDSLRIRKSDAALRQLTIRGVTGPDRQQPRFYCRSAEPKYHLGGTIPARYVAPSFFRMAVDTGHPEIAFENLHIDGYGGALKLGNSGDYVVRNSYLHHGPDNGIASANIERLQDSGADSSASFTLQLCGSEISHYGQSNSKHNLYLHRALGGGRDNPLWMAQGAVNSWSEVLVVDSLIHSPGWGSAFKSIANKNILVRNKFFSELETDPGYPNSERFSAQMLIDVPACSENIIRGNELHGLKTTKHAGGVALLGLRNRRTAIRGCDIPTAWESGRLAEDAAPSKVDGAVHQDKYWRDLGGAVLFTTSVEGNYFEVKGAYAHLQTAVEVAGTYPVYEGSMKQSCWLPTTKSWYERSRVYLKDNHYAGFRDFEKIFRIAPRNHSLLCQNSFQPPGPGPVTTLEKLIDMGSGETYHYQGSNRSMQAR
jgi:hypothetical protein